MDTKLINAIKMWLNINDRPAAYLAKKCGVSSVSVHYWIKGVCTPSAKHRTKIQELTGIKL